MSEMNQLKRLPVSSIGTPSPKIAPPGSMQGQDWWMADDFDAPIDEIFDCLRDGVAPAPVDTTPAP